jgi:tRNA dimethylallyltransferase
LSILNPKLSNCIEEKEGNYEITNNCESQIGEFLNELDNEYVNEIKDIYSIAQEQSMLVGVRKVITYEFCEILSDIGFNIIDKNYCFHDYEIKIDTLLDYYEENLELFLTVKKLFDLGGVEEVELAYKTFGEIQATAMKALGVHEIIQYIKGKISLDEAIKLASAKTRQYAKRQTTWFKNQIKSDQVIEFDSEKQYHKIIDDIILHF